MQEAGGCISRRLAAIGAVHCGCSLGIAVPGFSFAVCFLSNQFGCFNKWALIASRRGRGEFQGSQSHCGCVGRRLRKKARKSRLCAFALVTALICVRFLIKSRKGESVGGGRRSKPGERRGAEMLMLTRTAVAEARDECALVAQQYSRVHVRFRVCCCDGAVVDVLPCASTTAPLLGELAPIIVI